MNDTSLLFHHCLGQSCFASLDALVPRVLKLCVAISATASEPGTATTATAKFTGFLNSAALETCAIDVCCSDCCCWHVQSGQIQKTKPLRQAQSSANKNASTPVNLGLTFASLHALKPAVTHVSIANTSAILVPSTARSATTDSPRFLECAAARAYHY